ncbi:hypothetical protein WUBG_03084 [Wuchereria bancrofti]|uniref:PDZ domain-containing protein n=1 Tax=Wuchereria bancrofti TaxID=6293 RepID=J9F8Z5_WUCBA|nr:hypothetical protein WUBG_03084 [Wuchereria bancrofti]
MLEYPLLPSYQESIAQTQHASVLKSSAQLPKITTARVPYPHLPQSVAVQQYMSNSLTLLENDCIVATITSQCSGLIKANLTHGVRKVILNRTKGKKYGLRMRAVNQGVFVQLVADGSPAAAAGIRFGDQLLNLNGTEVLGMSGQKVFCAVRFRPLARTITLHKDATGLLGFAFKDNLITAVMQESSASRNGLLINQRIIEVDGQNVMAFKNKAMKSCLDDAPMTVTLTLMPAEFYDEITKKSCKLNTLSVYIIKREQMMSTRTIKWTVNTLNVGITNPCRSRPCINIGRKRLIVPPSPFREFIIQLES